MQGSRDRQAVTWGPTSLPISGKSCLQPSRTLSSLQLTNKQFSPKFILQACLASSIRFFPSLFFWLEFSKLSTRAVFVGTVPDTVIKSDDEISDGKLVMMMHSEEVWQGSLYMVSNEHFSFFPFPCDILYSQLEYPYYFLDILCSHSRIITRPQRNYGPPTRKV